MSRDPAYIPYRSAASRGSNIQDGSTRGSDTTSPEAPSLEESFRLPNRVGSRELKTRLGSYLRLVRQGASFVVTDRGRPVAELRPLPISEHDLDDKLYELAAAGVVGQEIAERRSLPDFRPVVSQGGESASQAILEDREDRF